MVKQDNAVEKEVTFTNKEGDILYKVRTSFVDGTHMNRVAASFAREGHEVQWRVKELHRIDKEKIYGS